MAADISVSIGVDGESKFKKALRECQNSVKQIDSALKANAAEWDNNADAMGENAERTRLLRQSIETQKKMMDGLGEAIEYASKEYGEASKQTTEYIVAQNRAREAIAKLEKELKDADREAEELGRDSMKVGRQLAQGIGEGAEDAADSLDSVNDLLDGIEGIKNMMGFSVAVDVIGGVVGGINDLVEGSEEFNRQMSYLEQNAKDAGISMETVGKNLAFATGVTGEYEEAVEGLSNLLGAKLDAKELADSMNLLLGAVIKMPDTWKFESLAEGLRQTLEEKKAVGQFADLLSYLNVDLETFNKAMEKTGTLESAQDVLMGFISNRGLESTLSGWASENQDMIDEAEAAYDLNVETGKLAETMRHLHTEWKEMNAAAVGAVTKLLENTQVDEWVTERIGELKTAAEELEKWFTPEGRAEKAKQYEETQQLLQDLEDPEYRAQWLSEQQHTDEYLNNLKTEIAELEAKLMDYEAGIESAKERGDADALGVLEKNKATMETELEELKKHLEELETDTEKTGEKTGEGLIASATNAIKNETPELIREAGNTVTELNNEFAKITLPDIGGTMSSWTQSYKNMQYALGRGNSYQNDLSGGRTPLENKTYQISMSVNGKNFARAIMNDMDIVQGRTIALG